MIDVVLPELLAVSAIETDDAADGAPLVGLGYENAVLPYDRCRIALMREGHFPFDVLGAAPLDGHARFRAVALPGRAAPRGPVIGHANAAPDHDDEDSGVASHYRSPHRSKPNQCHSQFSVHRSPFIIRSRCRKRWTE